MVDLFDKTTSKNLLYGWLKKRGHAKTSEIIQWGCRNFSNRADRNARQLAKEGLIRRMDEDKKVMYFGNTKESVWEVV